jgi:protein-L-isoaspartate(D-aspartate) O-methyltransferase
LVVGSNPTRGATFPDNFGCDFALHFSACRFIKHGWLNGARGDEMGMEFAVAREQMVDNQLRPNGITDHRILMAMMDVRREAFVPPQSRKLAYLDDDIALGSFGGHNRYLMEPMHFARLVQLAELNADSLALVVGCTTGYSCAVMAQLANAVVGIEDTAELANEASETLLDLGIDTAAIFESPLSDGYADQAPYDAILIEGAVQEVPDVLFEQLVDGGRLVTIVQDGPMGRATLFRKSGSRVSSWPAYDATGRILHGFARQPGFVF